jgi:hypothetical protein
MVELYMLKQDKNRKYSCPVQLAVYGHTVEGTIYLTISAESSFSRLVDLNGTMFHVLPCEADLKVPM